ncbi:MULTISPECIES: heavy-metal-associated domain-containing protein [Sphingomonadales]|jgi:copper chaperone|uniref:heavy-metal-associated domain-containing protein n=1 Tax=Alphaproteobacteria TaxID=28211 RepID=UPI000C588F5E|nr:MULTISPECIES: heavy-metal-associated domain-containing protein [Sphingomonadales]MAB09433.1 heavy metal transport/detoxification protein [Hyphomonas sp.]MAH32636.1 heavy metal transport/detoxification protein [Marinobacter sp.]MBQ95565.1 heavy metal transport/detoxification protein [Actinomycetota bacterium]MEC9016284.1 heavy-metal-associated domain-containing protein [Pseudomonadota bacterium]QPL39873.1 heavy-metal-associated domain-containing protein [Erythrobacter sp. A30-3]HAG36150.1 c|tara:strand:+ start:456 stop:659 length:204 start_codon:yes stop_codon:yes gene_type:complete
MQFHVENMSCGSCVKHITQAIAAIDPNAKVDVNIADKKVTVDSVASAQDIEAALAEDGYPARVIEQV